MDTDVVVLAIAMFRRIDPDELWLSFGTGSNLQHMCDTVSAFGGRSKKIGWNTWKVLPEVTSAFEEFLLTQADIRDSAMAVLERFVVLLYD